jgi:hypothetical protein
VTDDPQSPGAGPSLELGTGFRDDDVTVLLDGREVWRGSGVTTNYSVGLATVVPLPAGNASQVLEVRVGNRSLGSQQVEAGNARVRVDLDPTGTDATWGAAPEGPVF